MDSARGKPDIGRALWIFFRSNDLAVVLLLLLAILFAGASVVRECTPGSYEGLHGDDIRFFLERFRPVDLWFWLIAASLLLLGVSLGVCTIDSLVGRRQVARLKLYDFGPILIHVGIGLALLSHAIGGIGGSETVGIVSETPRQIGDHQVTLVDIEETLHPDGSVRNQSVGLSLSDASGKRINRRSGFNDPIRWDGGTEMLLLLRVEKRLGRGVLVCDGIIDTLDIGAGRRLEDGGELRVEAIYGPPDYRVPVAQVRIVGGPRAGTHLVARGIPGSVRGIEIVEALRVQMAMLSYRRAPSTVWLLISAILFSIGAVLTGAYRWRIVQHRSPSA